MKSIVELQLSLGWGNLFIYISIVALFSGLIMAILEDVASKRFSMFLKAGREKLLLPIYIIFWFIYAGSLFIAERMKVDLPIYKFALKASACTRFEQGNKAIQKIEKGCIALGNITNETTNMIQLRVGHEYQYIEKCELVIKEVRPLEEYKDEFDKRYSQSMW